MVFSIDKTEFMIFPQFENLKENILGRWVTFESSKKGGVYLILSLSVCL